MKFAFVIHPLSTSEMIKKLLNMNRMWWMFLTINFWSSLLYYYLPEKMKKKVSYLSPKVCYTFDKITSLKGVSTTGKIVNIVVPPEQFMKDQQAALDMIKRSYHIVENWGVEIFGLGALTGIIGSSGKEIEQEIPVAITTGTSYLIYNAVETLKKALHRIGKGLSRSKVSIIGFPGWIGASIAHLLGKKGANLNLVGRIVSKPVQNLRHTLMATYGIDVELNDDITQCFKTEKIIVAASTREGIINQHQLSPGSIVIDVSLPKNVVGLKAERDDILVIDGGIVGLPETTNCKHDLFGYGKNNVLACLAEPIILALENRNESFSVGRNVNISKVEEIGALGEKHGFAVRDLIDFNNIIPEKVFHNVRKLF
ncbi:MAG: hypothetical protein ACXAC5_12715 [Promethearchaeota archaeon]|jgi:predicted amino acid dehydrogenase